MSESELEMVRKRLVKGHWFDMSKATQGVIVLKEPPSSSLVALYERLPNLEQENKNEIQLKLEELLLHSKRESVLQQLELLEECQVRLKNLESIITLMLLEGCGGVRESLEGIKKLYPKELAQRVSSLEWFAMKYGYTKPPQVEPVSMFKNSFW